ncbi:Pre-mRNA-splicing factor Cwf15/Cwc15 [Papiliotrema laurentii]|uniref:Pre-mRNA-splicing factor Cwf15/Cwc15 n=1 Tax=Papiliotrema laurentii TaxID=5418 RepID=A0AAD9FSW9_PAPLA|nr:Pre-mRNA-splicing factor Cwf15/Cwc15 [Papiliotrema laurentii]
MSQAHRPTWNPTLGRETKVGSQQVAKLSLAAHTKLKFRQPGQNNAGDIVRRDLKAELAAAERAAAEKKRKAAGLPPLPVVDGSLRIENGSGAAGEDEEDAAAAKRRKVLEEALEMDKDDSDDEDEAPVDKGKGKALDQDADEDEDEDEDEDDDDDSDEDETAELMAELAKIKQERAEEKARLDAEAAAKGQKDRDEEIATGNPLLNLQAALGQAPSTPSSVAGSNATFAVKRRWDDDLIFKNQAAGVDEKKGKGEFVNDLLRSEFHKKFMLKYIK